MLVDNMGFEVVEQQLLAHNTEGFVGLKIWLSNVFRLFYCVFKITLF